ncbi:MAG: DUF4422 domain-containing protein [Pseudobutyrivibrio sp.]|nr:DUF4422 domain-containing protein [Pseudobutyrivibrio sp.]
MNTSIYVLTHKKFEVPFDKTYVPLQVGSASHDSLGYLTDDTGDNISVKNCYYSELTGVYWVWKNVTDKDIVGVCHYRRFLINDKDLVLTKSEIENLLSDYQILTSMSLDLNFSYYYGFGKNHAPEDLDITMEVIGELYPDFLPVFDKLVHENHTYFGNIMYCKKELFDEYCSFLFPIFERMHSRMDLDKYDDYHKRLYGFISEFILFAWCKYKGLKVKECKVGFIGEKAETVETKRTIDQYLKAHDVQGAKNYFLEVRKTRPDVLMEASDITRELRLCLQIISTCEFEQKTYGKIIAPIDLPFDEMISWVRALNKNVMSGHVQAGKNVSPVAIDIAKKLYCEV